MLPSSFRASTRTTSTAHCLYFSQCFSTLTTSIDHHLTSPSVHSHQADAAPTNTTTSSTNDTPPRPLRSSDIHRRVTSILNASSSASPSSLISVISDPFLLRYSAQCLSTFAKGYKNLPDAWFDNTAQQIRNGTFTYGPIVRRYMPVASRTKERRWAEEWERFGDLVVAQTVHTALVHSLDHTFLPTSHGGRLRGSPHTALHHIFTTFGNGVRWVIRGKWDRCRDHVPLHAMLAAVQRHVGEGDPQSVGDPQGAKLVMDTVRVPVREVRKAGAVCEVLDVGIPLSNPVYAPVVNMLFDPVDRLVASLASQHNRGKFLHKAHLIRQHEDLQEAAAAVVVPSVPRTPPEANAFVTTAPLPTPESLHTLHTLFPTHAPPDGVDMGAGYGVKGYTAIEYVRFLDEFVIGVAAGDDGQLAQEVFQQVQKLCITQLQLDPDGVELIPFEYKGHLEYKGPLTSTWDSDDAEQSHDDSDTRQYSAHDDHDSDTGGLYRSHDDDDDDDVDDDDGDDDDDDEEEEEEEEEEGNNTHPPYNNNKPPTIQFLHTAFSPSPVHRHEHTGIQLTLPYIPVLQQLRIKGYLQGAHRRGRHPTIKSNHKGSSYGPLVTRPHASILQYFNKRLHGLTALYACVANKGAVRGVLFHVKQSVACTLANKFKLQSMGKTYKKFGLRLLDPWTNTCVHNMNAAATGPPMFDLKAPMPTLHEVLTGPITLRCMTAGHRYRTDALKRILSKRRGKHRLPSDWSPVDSGFAEHNAQGR